MNYGEVLNKSWKIIWKHKILWLFGLLASCGRGGGGGGGGGGSGSGIETRGDAFFNRLDFPFRQIPPWLDEIIKSIEHMAESGMIWLLVAGIIAVVFLSVVITIALNVIGRAGLVRGTWRADDGEEKLAFGSLLRESLHPFWRVFLLILLIGVVAVIVIAAITVPLILFGIMTMGIGLIFLLPLICLLIPVGAAVSAFEELAVVAIAGEDKGVFDSIRRAWRVVCAAPGPLIVMALILFIGGGIIRIVIELPAILILIPIVTGFLIGSQSAITGGFITAGVLFLIYLPVAILLSSVLQAYLGSAWALTFRRLAPAEAKTTPEAPILDLPETGIPAA